MQYRIATQFIHNCEMLNISLLINLNRNVVLANQYFENVPSNMYNRYDTPTTYR